MEPNNATIKLLLLINLSRTSPRKVKAEPKNAPMKISTIDKYIPNTARKIKQNQTTRPRKLVQMIILTQPLLKILGGTKYN